LFEPFFLSPSQATSFQVSTAGWIGAGCCKIFIPTIAIEPSSATSRIVKHNGPNSADWSVAGIERSTRLRSTSSIASYRVYPLWQSGFASPMDGENGGGVSRSHNTAQQ